MLFNPLSFSYRQRFLQSLFLLAAAAALIPKLSAAVLPLANHNRWVLKSPYVTNPVVLSVESDQVIGPKRRVSLLFTNPWLNFSYIFNALPTGLMVEGVTTNGTTMHFDDPVQWMGVMPASGLMSAWNTPFGPIMLVSTTDVVQTRTTRYENCWHYQIGTGSTAQHWFLAPDVGFVQFGTGPAAFVLDTAQLNPYIQPVAPIAPLGACPKIGIDVYPVSNAVAAGARFTHLSATWAELETAPRSYSFAKLQSELATAGGQSTVGRSDIAYHRLEPGRVTGRLTGTRL